jgi:hypothetical protein
MSRINGLNMTVYAMVHRYACIVSLELFRHLDYSEYAYFTLLNYSHMVQTYSLNFA